MPIWGGDQNVSRPMLRCHEMSQRMPTMMLVEAKSRALRYAGRAAARSAASGRLAAASAMDAAMGNASSSRGLYQENAAKPLPLDAVRDRGLGSSMLLNPFNRRVRDRDGFPVLPGGFPMVGHLP